MAERLQAGPSATSGSGSIHGRLAFDAKDAVMRAFKAGEIDVLVATTVIEVGIDVPNASVMLVEHAERFGLAQLHQLRGRVGRGAARSYCILLASEPMSDEARQRLDAMADTQDGFRLAEVDLEIRGPGEFFGTRQSGLPEFRTASLVTHARLLEEARQDAAAAGGARSRAPPSGAPRPARGARRPLARAPRAGVDRIGSAMRVIGGHDRGRRLRAPRGLRTRPTADRVRVTLFDVLGPAVAGARVLDLFAGTGAVGIEALSRGAARVVLVERDQSALRALRANLAALGASRAAARVMAGDVLRVLPELGAQEGPFDFVFVDPPYATTLAGRTLEALAAARICRDGTEVVVQHSTRTVLPGRAGPRRASPAASVRRHRLDFPASRRVHSRRLEALSAPLVVAAARPGRPVRSGRRGRQLT